MFTHFDEIETFMLSRKAFGIKPGLERMKHLLRLLDHPEDSFKSVHIAGTNGKGSTIEFLKKALIANGYRVGVFTSPSISGLTGHIWYNDQKVPTSEWIHIINEMYPLIQKLDNDDNHPTSFEIITAIAFVYFSRNIDIALIETGMGGRYDTTNCLQPILSIITNVAKDHTAFLGNSIKEIAYHKAGIIKQGAPVILGGINSSVLPVFEEEATIKHTDIYQLHHHFGYYETKVTRAGQTFIWQCGAKSHDVTISMKGIHQIENVSLAIMALTLLNEVGFVINWHSSLEGIHNTVLSGRFEKVHEHPIIIVDGAHNPAGTKSFIETVNTTYPEAEKHLIFAAYKDKDIQTMLDIVSNYFQTITLTSFSDARAASADFLYQLTTHEHKQKNPEWKEVIGQLVSRRKNAEGIYFITGSLAFISEVRSYLID